MIVLKAKVKIDAYSKIDNSKLHMWLLILAGVILLVVAFFAKKFGILVAFLALAALAAGVAIKFFIVNGLPNFLDEEAIQFAGMQGSGKSFFMAREAARVIRRQKWYCAVNQRFAHYALKDFIVTKKDLGHKDLGDHTILLWDEGNLDGFDNRDAGKNFADNKTLQFFLLHRQNGNPIIFTSQGVESLDKKIREDVIQKLYWCQKYSLFGLTVCVARQLHRVEAINDLTGKPEITYEMAPVRSAFFSSDAWLFGLPKYQTKGLYSTINRMSFDRGSFLDDIPAPDSSI